MSGVFVVVAIGMLMSSQSSQAACFNPLEDDGAGGCAFVMGHHECNKTTSATNFASPVSLLVGGATPDDQFNNVINKKLACCMNLFSATDPYAKFDCVQNSKNSYSDFNALWASADDPMNEGGQMNALLLFNGAGKPVTGFYRLDGGRCDEFSEFEAAIPIQPYRVGSSAVPSGAVIPLPPSTPYDEIKDRLGKSFPSTIADYKRCPILVRAAMLVTCPMNPVLPGAQKTAMVLTSGVEKTRCSAASNIQIHIRIEQLYEIEGLPKLPSVDTVVEGSQIGSVSLQSMLLQKYGSSCEPGTTRKGTMCTY